MRTGGFIEAFAMQARKTPVEYLTGLLAQHKKLETMEAELGISYQAIKAALERHGITRHKCKDFEYQGITDSFRGHCRRLGLPIKNSEVDGARFGLTKPQALDYALYRQTWDKYQGNMTHPNWGTIARQAAKVGMTKQAFLADLCKRHVKIESLAMELGVTHVAVTHALQAAGIQWDKCGHFDYCGVVDCLTNHCRRYGIEPWRVFRSRDKLGITAYQALDLAVLNKVWPTV